MITVTLILCLLAIIIMCVVALEDADLHSEFHVLRLAIYALGGVSAMLVVIDGFFIGKGLVLLLRLYLNRTGGGTREWGDTALHRISPTARTLSAARGVSPEPTATV